MTKEQVGTKEKILRNAEKSLCDKNEKYRKLKEQRDIVIRRFNTYCIEYGVSLVRKASLEKMNAPDSIIKREEKLLKTRYDSILKYGERDNNISEKMFDIEEKDEEFQKAWKEFENALKNYNN